MKNPVLLFQDKDGRLTVQTDGAQIKLKCMDVHGKPKYQLALQSVKDGKFVKLQKGKSDDAREWTMARKIVTCCVKEYIGMAQIDVMNQRCKNVGIDLRKFKNDSKIKFDVIFLAKLVKAVRRVALWSHRSWTSSDSSSLCDGASRSSQLKHRRMRVQKQNDEQQQRANCFVTW
jgi:hypothetical protein